MKPEAEPNPALKATPTSFSTVSVHQTEERHSEHEPLVWPHRNMAWKVELRVREKLGKTYQIQRAMSKTMMVQFSRGCCGHPEAPIPPLSHSLPFQLHSCFHHPYRVHQGICDKGWKNTTTSAAEARPLYCHELTPCAVRHFQKPHRCTASISC